MEHYIDVEQLSVSYDKIDIIKNMNLQIPKGKITMIIGSNGCGKSTLLKTIARVLKPKSGLIKIKGKNIYEQNTKELTKTMAVLPQNPQVPSGLLVKELVSYGRFPYQSPLKPLSEHDYKIIQWAMEATGVEAFADHPVDALSGGQRQRAWISMALAQETEILLLDEPTTYLDIAHQLEILKLLKKLNKESNRTIVMVLHELNNACKFADHIIGVKKGSIVFEGKPFDVITKENMKTIYGIDAIIEPSADQSYPICVDFNI